MEKGKNHHRTGIMEPLSPNSLASQQAKADAQPNRTDDSEEQSPVEIIHDGYTEDMEIYYSHVRDFYGIEAEAIVRELHRLRENRPESRTPSVFAKASPEFNQVFYDRALHRRTPIIAAKTVTGLHRVTK